MAQTPPDPPILNEEEDEVCFGCDSNIDSPASTEISQRPAEQVCPGPPRSRSRVHSGPPAPPILNEEDDEVYFGSDFNIERPVSTELSRRPAEQPLLRYEIFGFFFSSRSLKTREKYTY